jgi:hypothetical protein
MHPLVQTIVVIGVAVSAIALTFSLMELRHIRSIGKHRRFCAASAGPIFFKGRLRSIRLSARQVDA